MAEAYLSHKTGYPRSEICRQNASRRLHLLQWVLHANEVDKHNLIVGGAAGLGWPEIVLDVASDFDEPAILGVLPRECDPILLEVALVVSSSVYLLTQTIQSRLLKGREGSG